MKNHLKQFGQWMIYAGLFGFTAAIILSFTIYAAFDNGAIPALSFLTIMLGMAFSFPSMLEENAGEISTMRIIVFAIVMVFCVLYLKIGWMAGGFQNFKIDQSWIYILGLAFGSKVFQKFAEEENTEKADANTGKGSSGGANAGGAKKGGAAGDDDKV